MLEPDAVKAARPVLRGGRGSNLASLPDHHVLLHHPLLPCARRFGLGDLPVSPVLQVSFFETLVVDFGLTGEVAYRLLRRSNALALR